MPRDDERADEHVGREDPPTEPLRPSAEPGGAGSSSSEAAASGASGPAEAQPAEGVSEHEDYLWAGSVRRVPRSARGPGQRAGADSGAGEPDADAGEVDPAPSPSHDDDLEPPPLERPDLAEDDDWFDAPARRESPAEAPRIPFNDPAAAPPGDVRRRSERPPSAPSGGASTRGPRRGAGRRPARRNPADESRRPGIGNTAGDWEQAREWAGTTSWALRGAFCLVVAIVIMFAVPAHGAAQYKSASGFTSLAGFAFMAAALERIGEFALAPWWGLVSTKAVAKALSSARALHSAQARLVAAATPAGVPVAGAQPQPPSVPAKVGVTGAATLRLSAHTTHAAALRAETTPVGGLSDDDAKELQSAAQAATNAAKTASDAADDLWVKATKQRPTILLPMAAFAAVVCYCLHLFLLHGLAHNGVSKTHLAYVIDGLITGFAIAGGAQPFHDLVGNLTTSSTNKKAANGAGTTDS